MKTPAIFLFLFLFFSPMLPAQKIITVDEAIATALNNNYGIRIARSQADINKLNNTAGNAGMKVYGISSGFQGLITKDYIELEEPQLSGLLTLGGTILGTSREKPFKKKGGIYNQIDKPQLIKKNYKEMGLDALVCIGGNGTQRTAALLAEEGLNVIGIPKTIDNDVWGTDVSFGFDSAVLIATEAIDRLHTTANSHKRIMVGLLEKNLRSGY